MSGSPSDTIHMLRSERVAPDMDAAPRRTRFGRGRRALSLRGPGRRCCRRHCRVAPWDRIFSRRLHPMPMVMSRESSLRRPRSAADLASPVSISSAARMFRRGGGPRLNPNRSTISSSSPSSTIQICRPPRRRSELLNTTRKHSADCSFPQLSGDSDVAEIPDRQSRPDPTDTDDRDRSPNIPFFTNQLTVSFHTADILGRPICARWRIWTRWPSS